MRKMSPQYGRILVLCLVMAVLTLVLHRSGVLDGLELRSLDWRFVQRGARHVRDDIAIVAVDEKSLKDMEAGALGDDYQWKWPWPLNVHARLIDALKKAGASAIAFDIVFSETDPRFTQGEEALEKAIRKSGRVFLAAYYSPAEVKAGGTHGEGEATAGSRFIPVDQLDAFDDVARRLPAHRGLPPRWLGPPTQDTFWTLPRSKLLQAARGFGNIDIPTMAGGVYRAVEPVLWSEVKDGSGKTTGYRLYPHLALAVATYYLRVPPEQVTAESEGRLRLGNEGGIPVRPAEQRDTQATMWIDYAKTSPDRPPFPVYSYTSVLRSEIERGGPEDRFRLPLSVFKNKIVLVGGTAKAMSDLRMNPFSAATPGVETQAHALDTLLQRRFLHETGDAFLWSIALLLGVGLGAPLSLANMRFGTGLTALMGALYLVGAVAAFDRLLLVVPIVTPLIQIAGTYAAAMAYRFATEERAKREVRQFFEIYVSKAVAELVLSDPRAQKLGGTRSDITVLFSDIRNFTTMSERLPPEVVVRILNEYFDAMVATIEQRQGTLDKFVGDAIMVLFNAPLPQAEHARLAVETGLDMLAALGDLQRRWEAEGLPKFDIGIGICTGVAVVGNVGAQRRHQYTAIGDTVNTAARLESLNKEMGTHLLISESTYYQVTGLFEARRLEPQLLKGKADAVGVYEVTARRDWAAESARKAEGSAGEVKNIAN